MGLFGKKKEEEKAAPACACNGNVVEMEAESMADGCGCGCGCADVSGENCDCSEAGSEITSIKVLGSGCKACHTLYENVQDAVKAMTLDVDAEYVTDMEKIASYGVMSTPALVVNEKVVAMGKVMKAAEVEKLLHKLGF